MLVMETFLELRGKKYHADDGRIFPRSVVEVCRTSDHNNYKKCMEH